MGLLHPWSSSSLILWDLVDVKKKKKSLCQAAVSMEFSRQEYCSGLPFPSPGELSNPEVEPGSPALQAYFYHWATREAPPKKRYVDILKSQDFTVLF